jgi:hypothetical protein
METVVAGFRFCPEVDEAVGDELLVVFDHMVKPAHGTISRGHRTTRQDLLLLKRAKGSRTSFRTPSSQCRSSS